MGKPKEKQGEGGVRAVCGGEGACVQRPRFPLGAGGWALHQLWELQPEASGDQSPSPEEDGGGRCRRPGGAAWGRWAGGKAVETQGARSPP